MNLVLLALVALLLVGLSRVLRPVVVHDYEHGLRYRTGRLEDVLEAGLYWTVRPILEIRTIDRRVTFEPVNGQEVLTADGVTLKTSLAARYRVADVLKAVSEVEDHRTALHLDLQLALRGVIGTVPVDRLLETRKELGREVFEACRERAEAIGLELLEVEIRDVMFPGDLKKTFAQVAAARQEGLAALEKARGETAALRHLTNAAKLLDGNPNLAHLRLLQAIGERSGNTIVLGAPGAPVVPVGHPDGKPR